MKKEVIEKLSVLITTAFGLVAALAWNDAIKSLFAEGGILYFLSNGGLWAYAILVTILAVFMTIWIGKISQRATEKKENKEKKQNKEIKK